MQSICTTYAAKINEIVDFNAVLLPSQRLQSIRTSATKRQLRAVPSRARIPRQSSPTTIYIINSGVMAESYNGNVEITGSVRLNGRSEIKGNLTVATNGVLTHDRTDSKRQTIDLKVGDGLWVKGSGQINVDQKSSFRHESRSMYSASHGGKGSDGYETCECCAICWLN